MKIYTASLDIMLGHRLRESVILKNIVVADIDGRTHYIIPTGNRCIVIEFASTMEPVCTQEELDAIINSMPMVDMVHKFGTGCVTIADVPADIPGRIEAIGVPGTNLYFYISPQAYAIFEVFATHATMAMTPAKVVKPIRVTTLDDSTRIGQFVELTKSLCQHYEHFENPHPPQVIHPS